MSRPVSFHTLAFASVVLLAGCLTAPASAQAPLPTPPAPPQQPPVQQGAPVPVPGPSPAAYPAAELDRIVSPIALYPDPLLAQILTATTYYTQIPDAASWADQHHYLTGEALTAAMNADQVPWDPSVQALIPFPSVLGMMASAMPWTQELGTAFLNQGNDVMDAVQRMRQSAYMYGYLRTGPQVIVRGGPYIEVLPANPNYIVVPYYDPLIVFAPPRRGYVVAGGVRWGFGIAIGPVFAAWGWGTNRFVWNTHTVIINNAPWRRTWANRTAYVHPYTIPHYTGPRPAEAHRMYERSSKEREAARSSQKYREEHHR
jgi:hypothetical protein